MSQGATASNAQGTSTANPVCCSDPDLPPPPALGELVDPAEPHPAEPGAPDDAPTAVHLIPTRG
jgi:hypothetical protein